MARWRHLPPNDQGRFRASLDRVITKHRRREGNPVSPLRPFQRRCCRRQGDKRPTGMRPRKFDKFVKCSRRSGVDLSPSVREDFSKLLAQRSQSRQRWALARTQSLAHDTCMLPRKPKPYLTIPAATSSIPQRRGIRKVREFPSHRGLTLG